jgi:SAM-dependent methyltransferase
MTSVVETPRDDGGDVDWNRGWELWTDMVRFYPSGVHRRRLIGNWIAPLRPRTLLDVGCGAGHLLLSLRDRLPGTALTGADNAADTVALNRRRFPWGEFEYLDLGRDRLNRQFDAVVCSECVEHIEDDGRALENLVAMTGRHLLVTVPTGPLYPLEQGFGHLRHYRLDDLCRRIESLGLRIEHAVAWGFPFMNLFKRATNLRPDATMKGFGDGRWSPGKRALGAALTGLFYFNLPWKGPQLIVLARR